MEPYELCSRPPDEPHLLFHRGKSYPRANAWFGFTSFWGHLFHLASSVIATEDIDARDWMHALPAEDLTDTIAARLGAPGDAASLTEMIGDDLWIDFIADTGDDADVSAAVADIVFRAYTLEGETLPRAPVLLFGGDTAYPVATAQEIHNRVCVPFNRVLEERDDGCPRVLLGIPGNHDWYDGLDGFARMFRARRGELAREDIEAETEVDRTSQIGHFVDWVEAFRVGDRVAKRKTLPLAGYAPVQNASYFAVTLAPQLDLFGVDRQLRELDYTQRSFFMGERDARPDHGHVVVMPDPAFTMLETYPHGQRMLAALDIDLEADGALALTGDTHHYCRQEIGRGQHIVAGGGGAFLHPARIDRRDKDPPEGEFPGPRASAALVMQVPWQLAYGRAGFICHIAVALLYLPIFALHTADVATLTAQVVVGAIAAGASALLAGWLRSRQRLLILVLSLLCGVWVAALPSAALWGAAWLAGQGVDSLAAAVESMLVATPLAVLGFGAYLMLLTLLGIEHNQAYATLAHPGYKHFMRMRVRADGRGIDGWVIGKVDTLDPDAEIVLVDRWTWNNPAHGDTGRADREET